MYPTRAKDRLAVLQHSFDWLVEKVAAVQVMHTPSRSVAGEPPRCLQCGTTAPCATYALLSLRRDDD